MNPALKTALAAFQGRFEAASPLVISAGLEGPDGDLSVTDPYPRFHEYERQQQVVLSGLSNLLPLVTLRRFLHRALSTLKPGGRVSFLASNPDLVFEEHQAWPGERITGPSGQPEYHRPLRHVLELARLYPCRVELPVPLNDQDGHPTPFIIVTIVLQVPDHKHLENPDNELALSERCDEKYGPQSLYRRFNRLEEPEILDDLLYAFNKMRLNDGDHVLGLGANDGREFELFSSALKKELRYTGIDASARAIEDARERFPGDQHRFIHGDLAQLSDFDLEPASAVLLLNVLQCTTVDRDKLLSDLTPLLKQRCGVLVSLPNNHFSHHDILRRPLSRKDSRHDRSHLFKDLRYLTRFFYRAGFNAIESFGSYDLMLLARRT